MTDALALVIAGHGEVTEKNAHSLLDLNIPDGDISPFTVERVTRNMKGVKNALSWFESEELEVERVEDPIAKLLEYKKRKGWDAHLIVVPDPDSDEDQSLIEAALNAGITVKDLTGAYDDILIEEKPAANEVPIVKSGDKAHVALVAPQFSATQAAVLAALADFISAGAAAPVALTEVEEAIARQDKDEADAPFDGDTARVGSATKKPGTTRFFTNEDGHYRNAEGRRKKGDEVIVYLTDDEIDSLPRAIYDPEA